MRRLREGKRRDPLYTLEISTAKLQLTDRLRGQLIHKPGIDAIKTELGSVTYAPSNPISFSSVTLRNRIERFSEQFVADAVKELETYFNFRTGRALDVAYPDLLYFATGGADYSFNKSVAAAIGEGIAGFLVQRLYNFIPQARPLGLSPDIIMQRGSEIAFVEAKAVLTTGRSNLPRIVIDAAVDLLHYLATAPYLKQARYRGFIVGTEIVEADKFRCRILEISQ